MEFGSLNVHCMFWWAFQIFFGQMVAQHRPSRLRRSHIRRFEIWVVAATKPELHHADLVLQPPQAWLRTSSKSLALIKQLISYYLLLLVGRHFFRTCLTHQFKTNRVNMRFCFVSLPHFKLARRGRSRRRINHMEDTGSCWLAQSVIFVMILQNDSLVSAAAAHSKPLLSCAGCSADRAMHLSYSYASHPLLTGVHHRPVRGTLAAVFSKTYAMSVITCILDGKKKRPAFRWKSNLLCHQRIFEWICCCLTWQYNVCIG